jgi:hypothetical protein
MVWLPNQFVDARNDSRKAGYSPKIEQLESRALCHPLCHPPAKNKQIADDAG